MSINTRLTGWLGLTLCLAAAGCVDPGPIKPTDLNKYAQAMVLRMQQRGENDPGRPDPMAADAVGSLTTRVDPKTGETIVKLTIAEAVRRAVANNLDIRVMSFSPEISREEMTRAAAVFDTVVFAGAAYSVEDHRQNTLFDKTSLARSRAAHVGLRKHTITGADLMATYALTRIATNSTWNTEPTSYEPNFTLELTQPLLKGAGPEVNLAALRVARIDRRTSEAAFKERVETVVADVMSAYWALRLARRDLEIQEELVTGTGEVLKTIELRTTIDTTDLHVKQVEASLAMQRARVIRAKKVVRDIESALVRLVLGKQIPTSAQVRIEPVSMPETDLGKLKLDFNGQLLVALKKNSLLAQAKLAAEAAGINVRVAQKNLLPTLNLNASATWMGMDKQVRTGNDQILDSKYLSYSVGLVLEYPLGNREAEAARRRAKYERLQAIAHLQNVAVQIAQTTAESIRAVHRAYEELQAVKGAIIANKNHLDVMSKTPDRFSPGALQRKLQALESLAGSQRDVEQSIVDYRTALIQLSRVTGTILKQYGVVLTDVD